MQSIIATSRFTLRPTRRSRSGLLAWLWRCAERQRQRHDLAMLSDAALEDLGLTRAEAQAEARRPFWR